MAFDVARDKPLIVKKSYLPALKIFIVADYKNNYHIYSLNKENIYFYFLFFV